MAQSQMCHCKKKDKADSIFDKMKEYKLDAIEKKKYLNTCFKLDNLYKMLQHQQEYAIYKEHLNAKAVTIYLTLRNIKSLKKN